MQARGQVQAESGVYYAEEDIGGAVARSIAFVIDLTVTLLLVAVLQFADGGAPGVLSLLAAWGYLAALKVSRVRTLGYRLANLELVDLEGKRAALWRATCRFLFLFHPLYVLLDLVLLSHDPDRQTLRDKLTGTYVIHRGARPAGSNFIKYANYFVGSYSFLVPEVGRSGGSTPS